jgi:hypothetical protein
MSIRTFAELIARHDGHFTVACDTENKDTLTLPERRVETPPRSPLS